MKAFIVAYDLYRPGQDYPDLWSAIKSYGTYYHLQESVWIVETDQSAADVRDYLRRFIDSTDALFVGRLSGAAAWSGPLDSKWLKSVIERSSYRV